MKRLVSGIFFTICIGISVFAQETSEEAKTVPVFQMRLVVEEDFVDAELWSQKGTEVEYWLAPEVVLADNDIISMKKDRNKITGQPVILLSLSDTGAQKLLKFTEAHIGDSAAIIICGELVMVAQIVDKIPGGKLQISGNFTDSEIEGIISALEASKKKSILDIFKD